MLYIIPCQFGRFVIVMRSIWVLIAINFFLSETTSGECADNTAAAVAASLACNNSPITKRRVFSGYVMIFYLHNCCRLINLSFFYDINSCISDRFVYATSYIQTAGHLYYFSKLTNFIYLLCVSMYFAISFVLNSITPYVALLAFETLIVCSPLQYWIVSVNYRLYDVDFYTFYWTR